MFLVKNKVHAVQTPTGCVTNRQDLVKSATLECLTQNRLFTNEKQIRRQPAKTLAALLYNTGDKHQAKYQVKSLTKDC